jgi:hypothetical protein
LNPQFVEALMGWPTGWTGFGFAATEWCRWLRRMRYELSRLSLPQYDEDRESIPHAPSGLGWRCRDGLDP